MATIPQLASVTAVHGLLLDYDRVAEGVPLEALTNFLAASGLQSSDLTDVIIPTRTLKHRRDKKQRFTQDESDKLARVIRVFDHAVRVFGTLELGRQWMATPKRRFDQQTPLKMLATEIGGMMVEEMIWQIDEGMFA